MSDPAASPSPSPAVSDAAAAPAGSTEPGGERREFSAAARAQLQELFKRYPTREAALIPALHIAQREWGGWLPDAAIAAVAREVELPAAKVYGVVTFYDLLHQHQVGRHRIRICTNLPCMLRGSDEIMAAVRQHLGVGENEVTPDGRCSYVHFECLGSCDTAPMMMIDDTYHENLTPERVRQILGDLD
ncbi:MAG TPA: NADH-quinone oxidoreductase subunit NuoE [Thermoanaerobaculia bacterium]|nr:NADH-quinone oxidoreductase subunit NuoE [Thermoanaerobaculia bacterium]